MTANAPYKKVIGEKIHTMYKVIVVAIPENNDDYISVCPVIFPCFGGTIYYEGNKAEDFNDMEMEKMAVERAKSYMPKHARNYKMMTTYAYCDFYGGDKQATEKANEKLIEKLCQMTKWDFYNKSYR